ncbi:hypothetical protein M0802_011578, partial [Mischocyttarus mexicanus]
GPEEPNAWKEVLDASKESNICPQIVDNKFIGNEDCLQLNVYTPQLPENGKELKAVLCWIYGGSFISGQNSKDTWSPDYFIEEDLVVVAINYRLGALGFLVVDNKNVTGNAGLKDQNMALKWIRDNIKNFGGDPKKVTLVGQSAGSVSVGYHILSEKSKGLFRNTISMSGVPLCFWAYDRTEDAQKKAINIARILGYNDTNTTNLLNFFYTVDINVPLQPVLEDSHYVKDAFLSECSLKKYRSGDYNHGPVILGYVKNETMAYCKSTEEVQSIANSALEQVNEVTTLNQFSSFLVEYQNETMKDEIARLVIKFTTDVSFIAPIDYTQKLLSKYDDPIYYYQYNFEYNNSRHKIEYGSDFNGSAHGDEMVMVFYSDRFQIDPNVNNSVTLLQKRMTRMWANMVKYGNPTPNGTNDNLLNIVWPDSKSSGQMLWLDDKLEIHDRYNDSTTNIFEYDITLFASIIVVALQGMLIKVTDFLNFWKLDKIDASIWAITFLTVIVLDVEYGLIVGLFICLMKLIVIATQSNACLLALAPGTELYLDSKRYKGTIEIAGIKIIHYSGSINFASRQHFCNKVYKLTDLMPRKELMKRVSKKATDDDKNDETKFSNSYYTERSSCSSQQLYVSRNTLNRYYGSTSTKETIQTLILDFSAVAYIDSSGVNMLKNLINEYNEINVSVYITGSSGPVYEMMTKCNLLESNDHTFGFFPTISDAVHFAKDYNNIMTISA